MRVLRLLGLAALLLLVGAVAGFLARLVWPRPTGDYHPTYDVRG